MGGEVYQISLQQSYATVNAGATFITTPERYLNYKEIKTQNVCYTIELSVPFWFQFV